MFKTSNKAKSSVACVSEIVVKGLNNPRGIHVINEHTLLIVEAGSGIHSKPDGRLIKLNIAENSTTSHEVLLQQQTSMNMLPRMKRDEIMGLADVKMANGRIQVCLTDYINGSKLLSIESNQPNTICQIQGHINSLVYHPLRQTFFAVKPDSNKVIELLADGSERQVVQLNKLHDGQDAVPVCIIYDTKTDTLLVSLFSGEMGKDPAKVGIDFDCKAGKIVRVDPVSGAVSPLLDGLTAPTGIALTPDNTLYILELCSDFLEPLHTDSDIKACMHGGFRRYSGRLLACDLSSNKTEVIADKLDTPSNIEVYQNQLYISEGMGIPGRAIPNENGQKTVLSGFIRRLTMQQREN